MDGVGEATATRAPDTSIAKVWPRRAHVAVLVTLHE